MSKSKRLRKKMKQKKFDVLCKNAGDTSKVIMKVVVPYQSITYNTHRSSSFDNFSSYEAELVVNKNDEDDIYFAKIKDNFGKSIFISGDNLKNNFQIF